MSVCALDIGTNCDDFTWTRVSELSRVVAGYADTTLGCLSLTDEWSDVVLVC